jgi:uncharacterized protein YicC (UPF0701 family)
MDNWLHLTVDEARLEVARLAGQVQILENQLAATQASDDHRRAELEAIQAEATDARAAERVSQARLEEGQRLVSELRDRLANSEEARVRAEREREAIIAVLGRRARRQLQEGDARP